MSALRESRFLPSDAVPDQEEAALTPQGFNKLLSFRTTKASSSLPRPPDAQRHEPGEATLVQRLIFGPSNTAPTDLGVAG